MAQPPSVSTPETTLGKRARKPELHTPCKRPRLFKDHNPSADAIAQQSRETTQDLEHPQHLVIPLEPQNQWLRNAQLDHLGLQITTVPDAVQIRGIPLNAFLPVAQPDFVLLPQMIWNLRSLTPAQRFDAYTLMAEYGRLWMADSKFGPNHQVYWHLISEASEGLKQKEREWYSQFTTGDSSTKQERQARLQHTVQRQSSIVTVTKAEIMQAAQAEDERAYGVTKQSFPRTSSSQQPLPQLDQGRLVMLEGSSINNPIDLNSDELSPWSHSSSTSDNSSRFETPMTAVSSTVTRDSPNSPLTQGAVAHDVVQGKKRPWEISEDDEKKQAAKKARIDRTEEDLQRYENNKDAIEQWWRLKGNSPKGRWFEKLYAWKGTDGAAKITGQQTVRQTPVVKQRAQNQNNNTSQLPKSLVQSPDMTSPSEIEHIRKQWGKTRPDDRKHPEDKVSVPDYPREDTIENSTLRPNGNYNCRHVNKDFKCCKNGLSRKHKQTSIYKDLTNWKKEVERLVESGDLHVAHKTWDLWHDLKIRGKTGAAAQRRIQIDALLRPVQGTQHILPVPASQSAVPQYRQQPLQRVDNPNETTTLPRQDALQANEVSKANTVQDSKVQPVVLQLAQQHSPEASSRDQGVPPPIASGVPAVSVQCTSPLSAKAKEFAPIINQKSVVIKQMSQPKLPTKRMVAAAPKPLPNPDFEVRQAAMEAIQRQLKMNSAARDRGHEAEGVIVAGIDLSREPISADLAGVLNKVIHALKLEAVEATQAPSLPESRVPEEQEVAEVIQDTGNRMAETLETEPLWKTLGTDEASLFGFIDRIPDESWKYPSSWLLGNSIDFFARGDEKGTTTPDCKLTLMEEHAQWLNQHHDSTVAAYQASTSFDEFQNAIDTFDTWDAEGYNVFS